MWSKEVRERTHRTFNRFYLPEEETIWIPKHTISKTTGKVEKERPSVPKVIHHIKESERMRSIKVIDLVKAKKNSLHCKAFCKNGNQCSFKPKSGKNFCGRHGS